MDGKKKFFFFFSFAFNYGPDFWISLPTGSGVSPILLDLWSWNLLPGVTNSLLSRHYTPLCHRYFLKQLGIKIFARVLSSHILKFTSLYTICGPVYSRF